MKKYLKFIFRKLESGQQRKVLQVMIALLAGNTDGLDIKKLQGFSNRFRCRVGSIRIIYQVTGRVVKILRVEFRGNAY